jgi:hypothetical protein
MKKFLTFVLCAGLGYSISYFFNNGLFLIISLVLWGLWAKDPGLNAVKFDYVPHTKGQSNIVPFTPPFFTSSK